MLVSGRGVVLSSIRYGESSVICKIYTAQNGTLSFMVNGVYRKKATLSKGMLQPLSLLDIEYYYRENKSLQRIKEARCRPVLNAVQTNVVKSSIALFAAEVLSQILQTEEPEYSVFEAIEQFVSELEKREEALAWMPLELLVNMSFVLGFGPEIGQVGNYFHLQEGLFTNIPLKSKAILNEHLTQLLVELCRGNAVKASRKDRRALLDALLDFYAYQEYGFQNLKTLNVVEQVLS